MNGQHDTPVTTINHKRRSGVLLHPTSLPGPLANGDMGHEAYRFIEFLHAHGFKVWQMLPLGPTHDDKSPYQCLSAHAGNNMLISLDWLQDKGWLDESNLTEHKTKSNFREICLRYAENKFFELSAATWLSEFDNFCDENNYWLPDYALFMAVKQKYADSAWHEWPEDIRHRDNDALAKYTKELQAELRQIYFEQFIFFTQWKEIHDYARQHEVELFGDMPIFVAFDSADVWAQRENFLINNDGEMEYISGVPPDAFSDTGQRWGNPLYDWEHMRSSDYSWWLDRFRTQLKLFDLVRIDHFRGLQACWQIPQNDSTAINGQWVEVPGRDMLSRIYEEFHHLPLVAEDLGVITDDVIELKDAFALPGMKVLQFAFDGNTQNPHLPHQHKAVDLIYTGTHDNDTTLGWLNNAQNYNKPFLERYSGYNFESSEQGVLAMIRLALASVSFLAILPMQDILLLDSASRMNTPGTIRNNWRWRFEWHQLNEAFLENITGLLSVYQR